MSFDKTEILRNSLIQHGKSSDRVYLMKLAEQDLPDIIGDIEELAKKNGYTKIFVKVPMKLGVDFLSRGYVTEATVPDFYDGSEKAVFLAKYFDERRSNDPNVKVIAQNLKLAKEKAGTAKNIVIEPELDIGRTTDQDFDEMAEVYKTVFATYPFPIHDPAYLKETAESHVQYYAVRVDGKIAALASSEMDVKGKNSEMTDFATLPEFRKKGLAKKLLTTMEKDMQEQGLKMAYTIARAMSPGMNITFSQLGYEFGGTLVNNTAICGQIESMNVWYKKL
ncbi:putative beta-lysine N-acetyltransferase [Anaerohalosphaera lusitana]|uniref:Putative beta-lysine N-acetyltransferase n=1 Tax=Anaerohalosphaera lusitana TaxID=1936003 RepID=A0A1U9NGP2_9BACT|nr:putative beta-lysine N-acetyltransferase [Anaerohalosphaera lusitana]AQT67099.1 putative beta-lysine N-acetyltransferase [Anaerohalosphaera lusitana]